LSYTELLSYTANIKIIRLTVWYWKVIDSDGYRANVGIVIVNNEGKVFFGKRIGQQAWQFPQGGIDEGETPEQAMYRELYEEVGLRAEAVEVLASTREWLRYEIPERLIRKRSYPRCIGQKQIWFLLKMLVPDESISLYENDPAEFDAWEWVDYWYPHTQVINFKQGVYKQALEELKAHVK
jgi:putative (di)nucleoside polyphosphate hydrolase